jgi:hypothetical protein
MQVSTQERSSRRHFLTERLLVPIGAGAFGGLLSGLGGAWLSARYSERSKDKHQLFIELSHVTNEDASDDSVAWWSNRALLVNRGDYREDNIRYRINISSMEPLPDIWWPGVTGNYSAKLDESFARLQEGNRAEFSGTIQRLLPGDWILFSFHLHYRLHLIEMEAESEFTQWFALLAASGEQRSGPTRHSIYSI